MFMNPRVIMLGASDNYKNKAPKHIAVTARILQTHLQCTLNFLHFERQMSIEALGKLRKKNFCKNMYVFETAK
jgi:hypothetical protein